MKLEFSWQILKKYWYIKFHENLSSRSWVVPCRQTYRQTDMTKLIVTCCNFANLPINIRLLPYSLHLATITLITTVKISRLLREKIFSYLISTKSTIWMTSVHTQITLEYKLIKCKKWDVCYIQTIHNPITLLSTFDICIT